MATIYFIHGITGSHNNFTYLQPHFPGSQSFDLVGYGDAPKPNDALYDKDFFLRYLETKISGSAILVGHSMGAILAKDFALAHPALVERLFLLSYPIQKDEEALRAMSFRDPYTRVLLGNGRWSGLLNRWDQATRFVAVPASRLFWRKYSLTLRDYYRHTAISLSRSVNNTILKDDYRTLYNVRDKSIFIVGEQDPNADMLLMKDFQPHIIPGMRHQFFGYEEAIATIIKTSLANASTVSGN